MKFFNSSIDKNPDQEITAEVCLKKLWGIEPPKTDVVIPDSTTTNIYATANSSTTIPRRNHRHKSYSHDRSH